MKPSEVEFMSLLKLLLPRQVILVALLLGSVAVPYFSTDGDWRQWIDWAKSGMSSSSEEVGNETNWLATLGVKTERDKPTWDDPTSDDPTSDDPRSDDPRVTPTMSLENLPMDLSGPTDLSLRDVIRFDRTPSWVTQNWARVTTVLADVELEGFRVPLVTGTELTDFAGSITYYFNKQHIVQRIVLDGRSGDVTAIERFVIDDLELKKQPTLGAGLYTYSWNGSHKSMTKLSHAPIVESRSPFNRFSVYMEINHPASRYGMSPEGQVMLQRDRESWRW
jgi:hypothetical protein